MGKNTKKTFTAVADRGGDKILDAIRAPEKDFLTANYVANRSKEVADGMLKLAREGEAETVTRFIVSDAVRFETLSEKGQLKTLMETLEQLDKSQQCKVLAATESYLYGVPNATVIQKIVSSRDPEMTEKLGGILRGFDNKQRAEVFSSPRAAWWLSSYDQIPLLVEVLSPLSKAERQGIVNKAPDMGQVLMMSCSDELDGLFKGCKIPDTRRAAPTA